MNSKAYVIFSGPINVSSSQQLISLLADLVNRNIETVHLLFSCSGGSIADGMHLYTVLKAFPFKLITHNTGNIDFIGTVVFMAGTERFASSQATFLFHSVCSDFTQQTLGLKEVREKLSGMLSDQQRIGMILQEHSIMTEREVAIIMAEGTAKDASFALEQQIIHRICDATIPSGMPLYSLITLVDSAQSVV